MGPRRRRSPLEPRETRWLRETDYRPHGAIYCSIPETHIFQQFSQFAFSPRIIVLLASFLYHYHLLYSIFCCHRVDLQKKITTQTQLLGEIEYTSTHKHTQAHTHTHTPYY